jgi:hypothetical protein
MAVYVPQSPPSRCLYVPCFIPVFRAAIKIHETSVCCDSRPNRSSLYLLVLVPAYEGGGGAWGSERRVQDKVGGRDVLTAFLKSTMSIVGPHVRVWWPTYVYVGGDVLYLQLSAY